MVFYKILKCLKTLVYLVIFLNMFLIKENYFKDLKGKKFKYFFIIFSIYTIRGVNHELSKIKIQVNRYRNIEKILINKKYCICELRDKIEKIKDPADNILQLIKYFIKIN